MGLGIFLDKKKQSKYITKYIKENLDEVKIRMPKGHKEIWKQYAKKRKESLNSYIFRIINKSIMDDEIKNYPIGKRKKGGKNMNITFRDSDGKLYSKDILSITLDMEVSKTTDGKYRVNLNNKYVYDEEYNTEKEAEEQLEHLTKIKNELENEFRNEN